MTTRQTAGQWRASMESRVAALEAWMKSQQTQPAQGPLFGANVGGWVTAGETAPDAYARIVRGLAQP